MQNTEVFEAHVGMDVHKESIAVTIANPERGGEVRFYGNIDNDPPRVDKLFKKLAKKHGRLLTCYEAGPCGYRLYRQLINLGIECQVVAPSRIPMRRFVRMELA